MKIIVAGDTHGSRYQIKYIYEQAVRVGATLIIQVGDFGYYPTHRYFQDFINVCTKMYKETGIELWWLDGNHEDHEAIAALCDGQNNTNKHITKRLIREGETQSFPGVFYLPRGYRFELDDVSFMSYGGAYSVDRKWRIKFVDWFPQEMIDHGHIESLPDIHTDVLLSHDVPLGYKFSYDEFTNDSIVSRTARESLWTLVQKITPYICIGGHHHMYDKYSIRHKDGVAMCYITNCDSTGHQSYYVLDTDIVKKYREMR